MILDRLIIYPESIRQDLEFYFTLLLGYFYQILRNWISDLHYYKYEFNILFFNNYA